LNVLTDHYSIPQILYSISIKERKMTLSLVFRIQAVIMTFFGLAMLVAPGALMESFNVVESAGAVSLMRGMSLMVLAIGYISWQIPNWAGDNLKTVGMFFGVWHVVYAALSGYQISAGAFPADTMSIVGNVGPDVVLAILFFWKSRADT